MGQFDSNKPFVFLHISILITTEILKIGSILRLKVQFLTFKKLIPIW